MSTVMEEETKRRTAKREAALVVELSVSKAINISLRSEVENYLKS